MKTIKVKSCAERPDHLGRLHGRCHKELPEFRAAKSVKAQDPTPTVPEDFIELARKWADGYTEYHSPQRILRCALSGTFYALDMRRQAKRDLAQLRALAARLEALCEEFK